VSSGSEMAVFMCSSITRYYLALPRPGGDSLDQSADAVAAPAAVSAHALGAAEQSLPTAWIEDAESASPALSANVLICGSPAGSVGW